MISHVFVRQSKRALRARLDCFTKPCDIIHMIDFSTKNQSDGFIRCLHCLSDVFITRSIGYKGLAIRDDIRIFKKKWDS